jgi:hypothetical protein
MFSKASTAALDEMYADPAVKPCARVRFGAQRITGG